MSVTAKRCRIALSAAMVLLILAACDASLPNIDKIRDSKLFDRRIKETPRQKVLRECQQESDHFRVTCTHCHSTDKVEMITAEAPALTKVGERAQIMRTSPTFGQHQDCQQCHQTKFALNRSAEKLFGPGGSKYGEALQALKADK
ncbi:MAG TPA: hypothetical protein VKX17_04835 [Planctomycetota bacterium]|nr:hypothetical protein [Planctomycetota bacterium]